jgi:ketosteroid isomerase-like protein
LSDPIAPPAARRPEEVLELVSLALSDGDLAAALAQYEPGAPLRPWARDAARDEARDEAHVGDVLADLMELRLPLSARVRAVLPAPGLALVLGERRMTGPGPGGQPIQLSGLGSTVVRQQPDGTWRIVADAWCLQGSAPAVAATDCAPCAVLRRRFPRVSP